MANDAGSGHHSGQEIYKGLLAADVQVVASVWERYLPEVRRAIHQMGGTDADARVFFQAALVESARLYRSGGMDHTAPAGPVLEQLACAHFAQWLEERGQPVPEKEPIEAEGLILPSGAQLQQTQRNIFVWKQLNRLPDRGRLILLGSLGEQWDDRSIASATGSDPERIGKEKTEVIREFRRLLRLPEDSDEWPDWVAPALNDKQGMALWKQLDKPEPGAGASDEPVRRKRIWMWLYLAVFLLILIYGMLSWWMDRNASDSAVFVDNFSPPAGLWSEDAPGPDQAALAPCATVLQEADAYYQNQEYGRAVRLLRRVVESPDQACRSKACFYLGVSLLEMDDPAGALEYLAKIEDLDVYGEEIYWYQALSFVRLSEEYPALRDKAMRAVERFLTQTQDERRRRLAEQMLNDLSK